MAVACVADFLTGSCGAESSADTYGSLVSTTYVSMLGRQPTSAESEACIRQLERTGVGALACVYRRLARSPEFVNKLSPLNQVDTIEFLYVHVLRRKSDEFGRKFWSGYLRNHNRSALVERFFCSLEFVWYIRSLVKSTLARSEVDAGLLAFAKDKRSAHEHFMKALSAGALLPEVYQYDAECLAALGRPKERMELLNTALNKFDNLPDLYRLRGETFARMGNMSRARADLTKAVRLDPVAEYLTSVIDDDEKKSDLQAALHDTTEALRAEPDNPQLLSRRAHYLFDNRQYDQAIVDLSRLITTHPDSIESYEFRAQCYVKTEQYQLGLDDLNHYIAQRPTSVAYMHRAECKRTLGLLAAAIEDYTQAIKIVGAPQGARGYRYRASAYNRIGKYKESLQDYKNYLSGHPDDDAARLEAAELMLQTGHAEQALVEINKAMSYKQSQSAFRLRALCYERLKKPDLAARDRKKEREMSRQFLPEPYNRLPGIE